MDITVSAGVGNSLAISKHRSGQYLHFHPYVEGQILGNCRHLKAGGNATNSVANIGLLSGKIKVFQSGFPVYVTAYLHYTVLHWNCWLRHEYKNIKAFVFQKTRTTLKWSSVCTCCRRINISMLLVTQVYVYRTINKWKIVRHRHVIYKALNLPLAWR
jgi:hypothetical protein